MARTHVRYSRETFVPAGRLALQRFHLEAGKRPELLLGLFVALQVAEFAALGVTDRLDLAVAVCISASLLTVATSVSSVNGFSIADV